MDVDLKLPKTNDANRSSNTWTRMIRLIVGRAIRAQSMSADGHMAAHGTRSRSGEFGTGWKHHRVSVDSRPSGAGAVHL
jgi:hypothetical protein